MSSPRNTVLTSKIGSSKSSMALLRLPWVPYGRSVSSYYGRKGSSYAKPCFAYVTLLTHSFAVCIGRFSSIFIPRSRLRRPFPTAVLHKAEPTVRFPHPQPRPEMAMPPRDSDCSNTTSQHYLAMSRYHGGEDSVTRQTKGDAEASRSDTATRSLAQDIGQLSPTKANHNGGGEVQGKLRETPKRPVAIQPQDP